MSISTELEPKGRRLFILYANRVRYSLKEWMESLDGPFIGILHVVIAEKCIIDGSRIIG